MAELVSKKIMGSYYIVPPTNLIFNFVSKNASTTLRKVVYSSIDQNKYTIPECCISTKLNKDSKYITDRYYKVAVFREPVSRFISAFKDKVIGPDPKEFFINFKKQINETDNYLVKLDRFIDYVSSFKESRRDHHVRSQTVLLDLDLVTYDKILKLNNLNEDWVELRKIYPNLPSIEYHLNRTDSYKILNSIPTEYISRIEELLKEDIKFYNELK